jgi:TolB-like protein/class 3 adenylate cyclase/Flp pilus assembly protein TadD
MMCATQVPMAIPNANRKLIAILYADVVGYSRMIGEDEEGTLAALASHMSELIEPTITRHIGRVVKTTGDGILAEFASPIAAALAALEIQEGLRSRNAGVPTPRQQWLRIGLTLGDVLVRDGDIFGDAVNVAARLQALAEPGSVYASEAVVEQLRGHAGFAWDDLGEKTLKNIARPIKTFRVNSAAGKLPAGPAHPSLWKRRSISGIGAAGLVALVMIAAVVWLDLPSQLIKPASMSERSEPLRRAKPSVAVLPFANQSGEPENDYFSDGITEDIINALGHFAPLSVMAYNATLPYKGKVASPAEVGRALGVRYLVEGSVRRADDRVRVSIRLTDAERGTVLWSEKFDEQLKDVFAVQDAITRRVAGTLASNVTRVEEQRALAKPPGNLDAYDLVLRGRADLRRTTRPSNREARQHFERALQLDANYAAAYAGLGLAFYDMVVLGWTEFSDEMLGRAEELARKALAIDIENVDAHRLSSKVHTLLLHYDQALVEIDQAISLNPSDAESHSQRGSILLWTGRLDEAIAAFETAFALNPNLSASSALDLGLAYYTARRHHDAVRFLEREALRHPDFIFIPVVLAATYGQLGRTDDSKRMAETVRRRLPVFDPKTFGSRFQNRAYHGYLVEGLRKAGLS